MRILSWNIQNGLGCDSVLSLDRIVKVIESLGEFDLICLQELSTNMLLADGSYGDQIHQIGAEFNQYHAYFGAAVDVLGNNGISRSRFGNLILSTHRAQSVFYHNLPQCSAATVKQMPRQMIELTVQTPDGPLRLMTTHLEYHCQNSRQLQLKRILDIHFEILQLNNNGLEPEQHGPYAHILRADDCVLCGDFNFELHSREYVLATQHSDDREAFVDAWKLANAHQPHQATCGIYDKTQWPQGPHARDFMFVSPSLVNRVDQFTVDEKTDASDHQPLMLTLS